MTTMNLSNHPAADLFPMLGSAELQELAQDIKANGLIEPVILFNGEVLDGRNRLAACEIAGCEPEFIEVSGTVESPVLYVISRNIHRRHLSVSQRAAIAAEMMPMLQAEAKKRQEASRAKPGEQVGSRPSPIDDDVDSRNNSYAVAGRIVGVGETSVQRAVTAKRDNPEGFEKVKRGEITVNAAAAGLTEQPERGGQQPSDTSTTRGKVVASAQKRRMEQALSTITGCCRGLQELDTEMAASMCSRDEITTWVDRARDLSSRLKNFAKELEKTR